MSQHMDAPAQIFLRASPGRSAQRLENRGAHTHRVGHTDPATDQRRLTQAEAPHAPSRLGLMGFQMGLRGVRRVVPRWFRGRFRVVPGWFRVVPGGSGWFRAHVDASGRSFGRRVIQRQLCGFGWLRVVPGGSGWFRVVPGGSGWLLVALCGFVRCGVAGCGVV